MLRRRSLMMASALIAATALVAFAHPDSDNDRAKAKTANPVKPTADSIAAGKQLYDKNCTPCHGVSG